MTPSTDCPKCGGTMTEGYLLELGDADTRSATAWVADPPELAIFRGLKVKGKDQFVVKSFRCSNCGFLESYAPRPVPLGKR